MKKFIIILLIITANSLSFSQIQKGKWLIGGSISTNNNSFNLNSENQYFEVVQKNGTLFCIKNAENGRKKNQEIVCTLRA